MSWMPVDPGLADHPALIVDDGDSIGAKLVLMPQKLPTGNVNGAMKA